MYMLGWLGRVPGPSLGAQPCRLRDSPIDVLVDYDLTASNGDDFVEILRR